MSEHQKVIDRIRKLLSLAQSANENEAEAAALKAQALLAEHNLREADLHESSDEFVIDGDLISDSRPWRRKLAANVARLYFCDSYYGFVKKFTMDRKCGYIRYDRHHFIGAEHNVIVAKAIFMYLCESIDRLALQAAKGRPTKGRASFVTSFRHGCAMRLTTRLSDKWGAIMEQKVSGLINHHQSNLPALMENTAAKLEAFLNEKVPGTTVQEYKPQLHSLDGAIAGHEAGDEIGLDVQVTSRERGVMLEDKTKQ